MITLDHYYMGRERGWQRDLTREVITNALDLVERVNHVLAIAHAEDVDPLKDLKGSPVASGWRPAGINSATQNAAKHSAHIDGMAVDLHDDAPVRPLARWCLANLVVLEAAGLYLEDPRWTWRAPHGDAWVHLQTRRPASGARVFIPRTAPPTAPALPEAGA